MKRHSFLLIFLLLVIFSFSQCSDNPVDDDKNGDLKQSECDSIASALFADLADSLEAIGDKDVEDFRNTRFDAFRSGFQQVLGSCPNNSIAHLGLSLVEILELNYSEDIWGIFDSLMVWGGGSGGPVQPPPTSVNRHRTLIGNQFSFLVTVPFSMGVRMAAQFPPNVTLHNIQEIIKNTVLPALGRAISHLAVVESNTDASVRLLISDNGVEEYIIIDLGEIYLFDASVHALRTVFNMMIAYDMDFFGPDGTYDWIDDYLNLVFDDGGWYYWCLEADLIPMPGPDELHLTQDPGPGNTQMDSILVRVLHHNLENRPNFLRLRDSGQSLANARQDIITTMNKLDASANFIRHIRTGETDENVIKLADLTDLDASLQDPDVPNFAASFTTVEEVFDFVRTVFSGPVDFLEDLGPHHTPYSWTMDLSVYFTSPIQDWNNLLPYHRWNLSAGDWIETVTVLISEQYLGGSSWWADVWVGDDCVSVEYHDIGWLRYYTREYHLINEDIIIEFLDGPGGDPVDLDVVGMPYFPDYTLNGIFPNQSRNDWLVLLSILE